MLTSCFGRRDEDVHDNTLGDDNGDGMIEDGTDDGMGGENFGELASYAAAKQMVASRRSLSQLTLSQAAYLHGQCWAKKERQRYRA